MREIESLNACFQSVMKASYVMKAARHACRHNHSCILLGYGLLPVLERVLGLVLGLLAVLLLERAESGDSFWTPVCTVSSPGCTPNYGARKKLTAL